MEELLGTWSDFNVAMVGATAALAGLLLGTGAPGANLIEAVTFVTILMTILIQAPTTQWLARKLGLLEKG